MKVVINRKYGGFELSHKAVMRYAELKGLKLYPFLDHICREVYEKVYGRTPTVNDVGTSRGLWVSYALVPQEEYEAIEDEESRKPVGAERYEETNSLYFNYKGIPRNDPILIQVVKELKEEANGQCAKLKIAEIPDDVEWEIEEYDGIEWVVEKHRTWE